VWNVTPTFDRNGKRTSAWKQVVRDMICGRGSGAGACGLGLLLLLMRNIRTISDCFGCSSSGEHPRWVHGCPEVTSLLLISRAFHDVFFNFVCFGLKPVFETSIWLFMLHCLLFPTPALRTHPRLR
jgi:hypothetical protein